MAFTHKAIHIVMRNEGVLSTHDELEDAIAAAESFLSPELDKVWILPATEVQQVS